jgi:hypothetical protein
MSRVVGQDDLAVITINNQEHPVVITSVTPQSIIAGDYTLIPTDDGWRVQNYELPHTIEFLASNVEETYRERLLTGVEDVDRLILLDLDYRSLITACISDQYTNRICQDDFFWQQKVIRDMGQEVMKSKLPEMNYREQYRTLIDDMDEEDAIRDGRLDYLIWMKLDPDFVLVNSAARHGRINILEWAEQHGFVLNNTIANNAAMNGKINVLDWLYEKGTYPDDFINIQSVHKRRVIEWLLDHNDIPIDIRRSSAISSLITMWEC